MSKFYFTPPLKSNQLFPISYFKFHYPCIQTHLFKSNFHSLPTTLSSPSLLLLHWIFTPPKFSPHEGMDWFHLFESNFHSLSSTLSPPKLFPPLKFCSSETLSSWRHGLMFEGMGVGLKELISFGKGLVSQRDLLIFKDLGFIWVWEWFHEWKIWCLKLWV